LQAILLAWQAILRAWHQPKNQSDLRSLHIMYSVGFYVADTLLYVPHRYRGQQLSHNFNIWRMLVVTRIRWLLAGWALGSGG
jgi:hypothetical protein